MPGPVDNEGVVHKCVNLGWDVVNVEKELEEKTGLLVKAGNDANVAALGEMWQGGLEKDIRMLLWSHLEQVLAAESSSAVK